MFEFETVKKNKLKGCFLSNRNDWRTPDHILNMLKTEFGDLYDPALIDPKLTELSYDWKNGLSVEWKNPTFINPPYDRNVITKWIQKGYLESLKGKTVIMLLPSRTDTIWFHKYVLKADEIRFIKGRIKFKGGGKWNAPFPSLIAVFNGVNKK